jgi:hypothetical protein
MIKRGVRIPAQRRGWGGEPCRQAGETRLCCSDLGIERLGRRPECRRYLECREESQ